MSAIYVSQEQWKIPLVIGIFILLAALFVLLCPMIFALAITFILGLIGTVLLYISWKIYEHDKQCSDIYIHWFH